MKSKVQRWGNSLAMRIPKFIAKQLELSSGSEVDISLQNEKIIIQTVKKKYSLQELLSKISEDNRHDEKDFGEPMGGEIW